MSHVLTVILSLIAGVGMLVIVTGAAIGREFNKVPLAKLEGNLHLFTNDALATHIKYLYSVIESKNKTRELVLLMVGFGSALVIGSVIVGGMVLLFGW